MFTGLVEKIGIVKKLELSSMGAKILFSLKEDEKNSFKTVKLGDSVSINGVCLTITKADYPNFEADVMNETLKVTNLKNLKKGDEINLERALLISSRLDGHIVSGHVDCCAEIKKISINGFSKIIEFNCDNSLIIKKGSIAINGVSLTVLETFKNGFSVSLIPTTLNETNLKNLKVGDIVNVEFDLFAKYVQKFLENNSKESKISLEFLKENGF